MTTATLDNTTDTSAIAAIAAAESHALATELATVTQWTTKAGRTVTRHSPIGALSAPKATQVESATVATVTQWANGQFRPFLKDILATLSDKQALAVARVSVLAPSNKRDSENFLCAALHELTHKTVKNIEVTTDPKGEKARIVATIRAILA